MTLLVFLIGFGLCADLGWLLIRHVEGHTVVLQRSERLAMSGVLGITSTMYAVFLLHSINLITLNRLGFTVSILGIGVLLFGLARWRKLQLWPANPPLAASVQLTGWPRWLGYSLATWVVLKVLVGATLLTTSLPYHDDVINNWNYRGKVTFHEQQLTLDLPVGMGVVHTGGVTAYPPTVPFFKAWLAALYGQWHDGLANAVHIVWYVCALGLLYCTLRRQLSFTWSALGTYGLASLPLYLVHGSVAYADLFVSAHIFIALSSLWTTLHTNTAAEAKAHLRLSALAMALLIFTKNEGLLLYLPPLCLSFVACVVWLKQTQQWTTANVRQVALVAGGTVATVLLPWLLYKWSHSLNFGNAKPVTSLTIAWQPGVLQAAWINTFFEGNWLLLWPLLIGLLIWHRRTVLHSPLCLLAAFVIVIMFGQLNIFLWTSVATEAVNQTGIARGFLHVVPVAVLLTTLLVHRTLNEQTANE